MGALDEHDEVDKYFVPLDVASRFLRTASQGRC
jgi:hypothetical protein